MSPGVLAGVTVVEIGAIGPAPFAGMLLADLGADVVRVHRVSDMHRGADAVAVSHTILDRSRRSVAVDLRTDEGAQVVLDLVAGADVLLEGFRPGVAERLGIGPEACHAVNPSLVYGRMTGWGQDGPYAGTAGHDITYIAVAGALQPIGPGGGTPEPPLNMLGDFGGGGMLLAVGVLAALHAVRAGAEGQVVDAAIVDGTALITSMLHSLVAAGAWGQPRGGNLFDGGAPFYRVYRCSDGRDVAVGAIEPQFYAELLAGLGLQDDELCRDHQHDPRQWPVLTQRFAETFATRPRDHWQQVFAGRDACVAPVLSPLEAVQDEHLAARRTFVTVEGRPQPAPAPRFSGAQAPQPRPAPRPGQDTDAVLAALGYSAERVAALRAAGVVG